MAGDGAGGERTGGGLYGLLKKDGPFLASVIYGGVGRGVSYGPGPLTDVESRGRYIF